MLFWSPWTRPRRKHVITMTNNCTYNICYFCYFGFNFPIKKLFFKNYNYFLLIIFAPIGRNRLIVTASTKYEQYESFLMSLFTTQCRRFEPITFTTTSEYAMSRVLAYLFYFIVLISPFIQISFFLSNEQFNRTLLFFLGFRKELKMLFWIGTT